MKYSKSITLLLCAMPVIARRYSWEGFLRETANKEKFQGASSLLSSDASRAFVSACDTSNYRREEATVNSFRRSPIGWYFEATITSCGTGSLKAVLDVGRDSKTVMVGCATRNSYAKILVEEQPNSWAEAPLLIDKGNATLRALVSVALAWDGLTAVIGGSMYNMRRGAVWTFLKNMNQWHQQGEKLSLQSTGKSNFGASLALSGDGRTLAVGADGYTSDLAGAVFIYTRTAQGGWVQQGPMLRQAEGSAYIGNHFGGSVALSFQGDVLLVGAPEANDSTGIVIAFEQANDTWIRSGELYPHDAVGAAKVGQVTSISHSGNVALLCGSEDDSQRGACWIFDRRFLAAGTSTWVQKGLKYSNRKASNRLERRFGLSAYLDKSSVNFIVGGYAICITRNCTYSLGGAEVYHAINPLHASEVTPDKLIFVVAVSLCLFCNRRRRVRR